MKTIKPNFEIWEQGPGLDGIYKQIERVGRVCYKSESHTTPDSAKPFVDRMIANKHYAMLEHGTVYLMFRTNCDSHTWDGYSKFSLNKYSKVVVECQIAYITTNLRVLVENDMLDYLKYQCEPTKLHEKRVTVHFTTQIAVSREFNRHRADSMAEQSTRYCNYANQKKFGGEIGINTPSWIDPRALEGYDDNKLHVLLRTIADGGGANLSDIDWWYVSNRMSEMAYMNLGEKGWKPQQSRVVLPLDTNTELVHTAFIDDWEHFFDLRALDKTGAAHPDAKTVALPLYKEFIKREYIKD